MATIQPEQLIEIWGLWLITIDIIKKKVSFELICGRFMGFDRLPVEIRRHQAQRRKIKKKKKNAGVFVFTRITQASFAVAVDWYICMNGSKSALWDVRISLEMLQKMPAVWIAFGATKTLSVGYQKIMVWVKYWKSQRVLTCASSRWLLFSIFSQVIYYITQNHKFVSRGLHSLYP